LVLGCGGGAKADADIRTLVQREADALQAHDLKGLERVWSERPDITLIDVTPPGRFEGWPAIAHALGDFMSRTSDVHMSVDRLHVEAHGDLAVATYDWAMTGKVGEQTLEDRGAATSIYRKEPAGWRLVHAHYSAAPRGAAPAAATAAGSEVQAPAAPASGNAAPPAAPPGGRKAS
ncbi:MAG TPA: nuclear transport factor 2 family protein, partial [Candidatus Polarisedimenticolia bacterium]|nr:nuclear transport factor 2 family protein [Candidatus Polarisedimenticolia bacterium]